MPIATEYAAINASFEESEFSAPKATPIARPSGILCRVIETTSIKTLFILLFSFEFPIDFCRFEIILSEIQIKPEPQRKPTVATSQAGVSRLASARSTAGCKSDQKLAASITPAEKPTILSSRLSFTERKKITAAEPSEVISQVITAIKKASKTLLIKITPLCSIFLHVKYVIISLCKYDFYSEIFICCVKFFFFSIALHFKYDIIVQVCLKMTGIDINFMVKEKEFYRGLFRLALPVILQALISVAVNMLDNIMVAYQGDASLSGVAMANQLTIFLSFFLKGICGSSALMISQYWGKQDYTRIRSLFTIVLRFSFKLIGLIVLFIFLFPDGVMRVFTNKQEILEVAVPYLRILCVSYIFSTLSESLAAMLRSVGLVQLTFILSVTAFFSNLFFNYCLIFGKFGFPQLGVQGAAIATVIARIIEFIVVSYYVLRKEKFVKYKLKYLLHEDKLLKKDFLKFGLPALIGDMQWGLVGVFRSMVIGRLGMLMISANSITETTMSLAFACTNGLANAACVTIGKSIGAKDYERTRQYSDTIQVIFAIAGFIFACILFFGRSIPISFYTKNSQEVRDLASTFLAIGGISVAFSSYHAACFTGINRGSGDTKFVFYVDMICGWLVVVPAVFMSGLVFKVSLPIVYFCTRSDQFFKWIVAFIRLRGNKWIKNVTRDEPAENKELEI